MLTETLIHVTPLDTYILAWEFAAKKLLFAFWALLCTDLHFERVFASC